jgi:hypothetical protein
MKSLARSIIQRTLSLIYALRAKNGFTQFVMND